MTDKPIVTLDHSGAVHVRLQRPCSQEFQLSLLELPALVAEIARVLPRDAHGVALIDQIIAAARAHRPRDLTSAEHQRRNTLKNAILTFARTEDHEYILHPEQLVTSMSAAAAKVLQEQIDAFHGPRDERLHSLQ